jgi:hypothetical protein
LLVSATVAWPNALTAQEAAAAPTRGLSAPPRRGQAIPLPDTVGANFPVGDSAQRHGSLSDYDALLGTWAFRFQSRVSDGSYNPVFTGLWTFEKKPGGGLVEDRWRPDDPSQAMGVSLYTYRVFDPNRQVWQLIGASSNGGAVQPGLTWSDDSTRYVIQRGGSVLVRFRYFAMEPDHFLWRSDRSHDGGRTWILDAGIMEARRLGR